MLNPNIKIILHSQTEKSWMNIDNCMNGQMDGKTDGWTIVKLNTPIA